MGKIVQVVVARLCQHMEFHNKITTSYLECFTWFTDGFVRRALWFLSQRTLTFTVQQLQDPIPKLPIERHFSSFSNLLNLTPNSYIWLNHYIWKLKGIKITCSMWITLYFVALPCQRQPSKVLKCEITYSSINLGCL